MSACRSGAACCASRCISIIRPRTSTASSRWSPRRCDRSGADGYAVDLDNLLVLLGRREQLPFDAVDVVVAREPLRGLVLEAEMAELAGALGQLVDREIELIGAEQGVLAGDHGGRRDAEPLAVITDRLGQVPDRERDVKTT